MKKTIVLLMTGFACMSGLTAVAQVSTASNVIASGNYVGSSNNFDVFFKRSGVFAGYLGTDRTSFGVNTTNVLTGSTCIGVSAGQYTSGSGYNTYVGNEAGKGSSGTSNSGAYNTFVGRQAGVSNQTGSSNVYIGQSAGSSNGTGSNNVYIGAWSGYETTNNASGNIFIGTSAGFNETGSNKLIIGNGEDSKLIWGDFALNQLKLNGKVGIGSVAAFPTNAGGVSVTNYRLFVTGGILTDEVRINASVGNTWSDYVFEEDYKLPTLAEVEAHIKEKGYLINVPSAEEVCENGIALGEMAKIQQEKIEELTLYIIEQNKINEKQAEQIEKLTLLVNSLLEKK